ncbi:MAG: tRNA (adenine(22)-N(1))-methyltransferase TrmK, partial [Lachnospiraceae bacterium]|nr:tRNA (adenine(22)-N(1))-methyltransferase TrmK [Lachnospiraceae bacterium]
LVSNGYLIEYEHMLCDEGKYYFIFHVLVKKDEREWSEEEYRYGKDICKDDMKTFFAYLEKEERQYEQILEKMKQAPENDRAAQRIAQLHQDITCLKKRRQLVYDCGCFA